MTNIATKSTAKRTLWLVILLFITNLCTFSANKLDWSKTKYKNVEEWIAYGKKHLRRAYRNGGTGPYAFDCSGFTMYMYKELGYALPHSSSAQADHGDKIKATNVKPGDLVFFAGSKGTSIGHVGIVIETTDEDFSFIHASLKQGICIDKSTHSYYKPRYKTARRIFDMTADSRKKKEEEAAPTPIPTPKPQEEDLELPGGNTDVDTNSGNRTVDNDKKATPQKKESRRDRKKRLKKEKAEKERLEKQRIEKEKLEKERLEKEKAKKKKQDEARQKDKKEQKDDVKKDSKKEDQKKSKKDEKPAAAKKTHIVEKGETMYRISKMAGLTVDELKEINGLKSNDLKIGQELIIEK